MALVFRIGLDHASTTQYVLFTRSVTLGDQVRLDQPRALNLHYASINFLRRVLPPALFDDRAASNCLQCNYTKA